jgi:hypothetical protein
MSSNGTLADRNNNPGNIRTSGDNWQGANGSNAGFVNFNQPEYGVRAVAKNLYTSQEKHGNNSVADIISRWAPPNENDTDAYINKVAKDLDVNPFADLGSLRDNPQLTRDLIKSIAEMEGASVGNDGKYTDGVLTNGVAMANGKPASDVTFAKQDKDFDSDKFGEQVDVEQGFTDDTTTVKESADIKKLTKNEIVTESVTPNWMSTVDSPTYRWTLYVVDNNLWNNPNLIGNDDSALNNSQAFIIARQGVTTEFTLDNFMSLATVTPGQRHGNATPGIIQFDIFENLGFTFMDKVLLAGKRLGKPANLYSQNFILKLEFLGRDPKTSASVIHEGAFLYPVKINQIRSTTGPEGTRYNVVAWSALKHAQTEAVLDTDITVKNIKTIEDFVRGFEKEYNDSQWDQMGPFSKQAGEVVPKQIEINFDKGIYQRPGSATKVNGKALDWFHLPSKPFAGTSDPSTSNKTGTNIADTDKNTTTAERETNIGMWLEKTIKNNCPAWTQWVIEANKAGLTPHIVVEPTFKYPPRTMNQNKSGNYGNVEPILVIYEIKIAYSDAGNDPSIAESNRKLADSQYQANRFKTLPIEKSYTYLYSGLNTEVINYQIDVNNLFFVVDQPGAATYLAGKDSEGNQQFSPAEITDSLFISDLKQSSTDVSYFNPVVGGVAKADSAEKAQVTEYLADDSAIARRLQDMAKREYDALNFNMEIKGDPHWMGNMQAIVKGKLVPIDHAKQDALITFLQFNPNADKLLTEQIKGEIDPISTGVYKLVSIESRFQGGRFTQTLNGYKDVNSNTALLLPKIIEISGV